MINNRNTVIIRFTALAIISAPSRTLSNKLSHLLNVSLILKFCDNSLAAAGHLSRKVHEGSRGNQSVFMLFKINVKALF